MSDQKTPSAGEPVDEPGPVDDVVGRANEGLARAEAAGRDATADDDVVVVEETVVVEPASDAPAEPVSETIVVESVEVEPNAAAPADAPEAATTPVAGAATPWYDRPESVPMDPEPGTTAPAPGPVADPAPVATAPVAPAAVAPQPIFVQAPEAPRPLGNRGAAGAIGLLAALAFAVLSFVVIFGFGILSSGGIAPDVAGEFALSVVSTPLYWVPILAFFLAFWLLGAILNRARWAHWVIWGLLVGVASYIGFLVGALFQAPFWTLTASEGVELLQSQLFTPYAIVSFVLGRELTVWFGAWVAARGARITELNDEAQREYERTLEAGPQLVRS